MSARSCESCAFRDPEAWVEDVQLPAKITDALMREVPFFCHHGLSVVDGRHQVPVAADGEQDTSGLRRCAGFARLLARHRADPCGATTAVLIVRRRLLERLIANPPPRLRKIVRAAGGDIDVLAAALDMLAAKKRGCAIPEWA